ncbi:MAG: DUF4402 domain-containing protein [Bdellovibrionales bacterium]
MKAFITLLSLTLIIETAYAAPITISQISDLDFGVGFLGDGTKRINRGSVDNAENASFLVTGDPGVTFSITLPGKIWMNHSSTSSRIRVRRFRSRPKNSGKIKNNGEKLLLVGATRNAIGTGLSTGSYSGTFTVTVVY